MAKTRAAAANKPAKKSTTKAAEASKAATKSAASKATTSAAEASKPAAAKPAASKPAASKPAASKPAASKPAASKPAAKGTRSGPASEKARKSASAASPTRSEPLGETARSASPAKHASVKPAAPEAKFGAATSAASAAEPVESGAVKPAAKAKTARPSEKSPAKKTSSAVEAAPRVAPSSALDDDLDDELDRGEDRPRTITEAVSAHPDARLSQYQVDVLFEKLVAERGRVLAGHDRHLSEALADSTVMPDETDMAQRSTEQAYLIRFADKERKLLTEIEHALDKMRAGEYGVCEGTDEPIGFKRLELRPWTRYSVGHKEQMERERNQHRR